MAVRLKFIVIIVPVSEVLSLVRRVCPIGTCAHHTLESYLEDVNCWSLIEAFLFVHMHIVLRC